MIRDEYKRAALKLYGLADADRAWIMSRLGADERTKLADLLSQLEELGLSRDAASLAEAGASSAPRKNAHDESGVLARTWEQIDIAPVVAIDEALAGEPSWMVAVVLRLGPWRWATQYLDAQAADRQALIRMHLDTPRGIKPKVREAVLGALAERVKECGSGRNGSTFERILETQDRGKRVNGNRSWRGWIKWMH